MWLTFLVLLLCLGYVAHLGVALACTVWCFYGLNCAIACVCLYDTSMLASMSYLLAAIRGLSLLVTHSLSKQAVWAGCVDECGCYCYCYYKSGLNHI
jgi:hypothetical protein